MVNIENVKMVNSTGFNAEKTKELIAGIQQDGMSVGIEDLAGYLRKQGLIVNEHIGRKRNYVEVSPKLFGVNVSEKGDDVKELFKEHIKMGKMSFIPDKYEKKLVNLESSLRMARRRSCIGYDETFMPLDTFKEFSKEFEDKKRKYFEVRDEIVGMWDSLIVRFKSILQSSLDELNSLDKMTVFSAIVAKLPSKEEYRESFYMTLTVKAFPVTENLDMFDESIQSQIKDGLNQETVTTLYEIIGNTLNDAFDNVAKVLTSIQKNDKVANKTLGSLKTASDRIAQKNIFNNPKITQIRREILALSVNKDEDTQAEQAENLLATIYGYAKELHIEHEISLTGSPLSADELVAIYSMIEESESEDATAEAV